ncbi:MAG: hypothetical protein AB7I30_09295 [Isosphaeraceae bacterium]
MILSAVLHTLVLAATAQEPPRTTDPTALPPPVERPERDAESLNLADLASYRAALEGRSSGEVIPASFREIWEAPERFQGKRVQVEGRVLRRFRQGAFGTFPPLVEAWALNVSGDPFCLVFPDPNPATAPKSFENDAAPGALVQFEGVFLRQIRYQSEDVPRLAPLIVGDRPPTVTSAAPRPVRLDDPEALATGARSWWIFGFVTAGLVAVALARRHFLRPFRTPRPGPRELDPPPEFVDPEP